MLYTAPMKITHVKASAPVKDISKDETAVLPVAKWSREYALRTLDNLGV